MLKRNVLILGILIVLLSLSSHAKNSSLPGGYVADLVVVEHTNTLQNSTLSFNITLNKKWKISSDDHFTMDFKKNGKPEKMKHWHFDILEFNNESNTTTLKKFKPKDKELEKDKTYTIKISGKKPQGMGESNVTVSLSIMGEIVELGEWYSKGFVKKLPDEKDKDVGDTLGLIWTDNGWTDDRKIYTDKTLYKNDNEVIFFVNITTPQNVTISYQTEDDSKVTFGKLEYYKDVEWVETSKDVELLEASIFRQSYRAYDTHEKFNISIEGDGGFYGIHDPVIDKDLGVWGDGFINDEGIGIQVNISNSSRLSTISLRENLTEYDDFDDGNVDGWPGSGYNHWKIGTGYYGSGGHLLDDGKSIEWAYNLHDAQTEPYSIEFWFDGNSEYNTGVCGSAGTSMCSYEIDTTWWIRSMQYCGTGAGSQAFGGCDGWCHIRIDIDTANERYNAWIVKTETFDESSPNCTNVPFVSSGVADSIVISSPGSQTGSQYIDEFKIFKSFYGEHFVDGNITSTIINFSYTGAYNQFCTNFTFPQYTNASCRIINASDNTTITGYDNIIFAENGSCHDISGISTNYDYISLFCELNTTNTSNTPTLSSWNITINTSVRITENITIPTTPLFTPQNTTVHVNATSTATVTNCNLTLCYEGNNTCLIDNINMTVYGDFWNSTYRIDAEDTWNWTVLCEDTYGASTTVNGSFSVSNQLPILENVTIDPAPAETIDDLIGGWDTYDPEGGGVNVSFQWFVNGVANETTQNISSADTNINDNYTFQVQAGDGYNSSDPVNSSTLWIGDSTPPTLDCYLEFATGYTDQITKICCTSEDDGVIELGFPKVDFLNPNTDRKGNYSMSKNTTTFCKNYTFGDVGIYTDFNFYSQDQSGNMAENTTNTFTFTASTRPADTPPGGGGTSRPPAVIINQTTETILNFKFVDEVIQPNDFKNTLPNDTWTRDFKIQNLENFPIDFTLEMNCDGIQKCCKDHCNLSNTNFKITGGKSGTITATCTVPKDATRIDFYSANVVAVGCRENSTLCDTKMAKIHYDVKEGYLNGASERMGEILEFILSNSIPVIIGGVVLFMVFVGIIVGARSGRGRKTYQYIIPWES